MSESFIKRPARRKKGGPFWIVPLSALLALLALQAEGLAMDKTSIIPLPKPDTAGKTPLETALSERRSVRRFKNSSLSLPQVAQLLWSGQGITSPRGYRTAPSGGALYPLELHLVAGAVDGIDPGIYRYLPEKHAIERTRAGDLRNELCRAALGQPPVRDAPASILISCVFARITVKYGKRGIRYAMIEAGHAGQNILLQAVALGLGAVPIGAFDDRDVSEIAGLQTSEAPLYIIPVGVPAK